VCYYHFNNNAATNEKYKMRKIIQFQDVQPSQAHGGYIAALCDDGTLWHYSAGAWSVYLEPIPQDELLLAGQSNET